MPRPQKITFADMREMSVRALLIYWTDGHCSRSTTIGPGACDRRGDGVRLSDLEPKFTCKACGKKGADVRPEFGSARPEFGSEEDSRRDGASLARRRLARLFGSSLCCFCAPEPFVRKL